jgi:hypothetical protein
MATASGSNTRPPADKPLTVKHLKDLLRLADIPFPARSKLADLRQLCEEHGIVARAPAICGGTRATRATLLTPTYTS